MKCQTRTPWGKRSRLILRRRFTTGHDRSWGLAFATRSPGEGSGLGEITHSLGHSPQRQAATGSPAGHGWERTLARGLPLTPPMETNRLSGHHRILLVEDDKLERMNLTLVLGREGFDLDVAANAAEAYALLAHGHYELVLTDIGLPDGSGLGVLHAAKRADAQTKVVLVTGSQSSLTQEAARAGGAESLILKPFALATILATVRGLMGRDARAATTDS